MIFCIDRYFLKNRFKIFFFLKYKKPREIIPSSRNIKNREEKWRVKLLYNSVHLFCLSTPTIKFQQ